MDHDDIVSYYNNKYKQLTPFKDKKIHQGFSSLMTNHFTVNSYEDIPEQLKLYIEEQKIHPNLYDIILKGFGYKQDLLDMLRQTQKEAILYTPLTDYYIYKGSIKHIKRICDAFDEGFNVYELYADYRPVIDEDGVIEYDWVMAPRKIYDGNDNDLDPLDYDKIYNATPTYFICKTQLEMLRKTKSIVFPFKTNLLILELSDTEECNIVDLITIAAALFYAKDLSFDIEFNGSTYTLTIGQAYELWYYVIIKYTNVIGTSPVGELIIFDTTLSTFPYTIVPGSTDYVENLRTIYENLEDDGLDGSTELSYPSDNDLEIVGSSVFTDYRTIGFGAVVVNKFYQEYVSENFLRSINTSSTSTFESLRNALICKIGNDIISDIDYMLENADNELYKMSVILGDIDDAIRTYIYDSDDEVLQAYEEYLMMAFGSVVADPEISATYQMIHEFKPFHTRLITQSQTVLTVNDKTNCATPSDAPPSFVTHMPTASVISISEDITTAKSYQPTDDDETTSGYYVYNDKIETDELGASPFTVGDVLFSREYGSDDFPFDEATAISEIFEVDAESRPGVYQMTWEEEYSGPLGYFETIYKIWNSVHELVDVSESDGLFTFTISAVICNAESFSAFSVGDYIYAPDDSRDRAVRIASKDIETYSLVLASSYNGTLGTYTTAYKWRSG